MQKKPEYWEQPAANAYDFSKKILVFVLTINYNFQLFISVNIILTEIKFQFYIIIKKIDLYLIKKKKNLAITD